MDGHLWFLNMENLRTGGGHDVIDGSAAGVTGYRVFADAGDDRIIGSNGNDTLEGGWGADTITGGRGDDEISMNGDLFASVSRLDGEVDMLVLTDGFGQDTIRGFGFGDELDSEGNPAAAGVWTSMACTMRTATRSTYPTSQGASTSTITETNSQSFFSRRRRAVGARCRS